MHFRKRGDDRHPAGQPAAGRAVVRGASTCRASVAAGSGVQSVRRAVADGGLRRGGHDMDGGAGAGHRGGRRAAVLSAGSAQRARAGGVCARAGGAEGRRPSGAIRTRSASRTFAGKFWGISSSAMAAFRAPCRTPRSPSPFSFRMPWWAIVTHPCSWLFYPARTSSSGWSRTAAWTFSCISGATPRGAVQYGGEINLKDWRACATCISPRPWTTQSGVSRSTRRSVTFHDLTGKADQCDVPPDGHVRHGVEQPVR